MNIICLKIIRIFLHCLMTGIPFFFFFESVNSHYDTWPATLWSPYISLTLAKNGTSLDPVKVPYAALRLFRVNKPQFTCNTPCNTPVFTAHLLPHCLSTFPPPFYFFLPHHQFHHIANSFNCATTYIQLRT